MITYCLLSNKTDFNQWQTTHQIPAVVLDPPESYPTIVIWDGSRSSLYFTKVHYLYPEEFDPRMSLVHQEKHL
jgi:hypothetical protein